MKKQIIASLLAVMTLASCSGGTGDAKETRAVTDAGTEAVEVTEANGAVEVTEAKVSNEFRATYEVAFEDGTKIVLGEDAEKVIASLGEYSDLMEAPSCVHPGFDRVYTFNGYTVTTSPDADGKEYAAQVALTNDASVLANGITIGSSKDNAVKAFGDSFTEKFGQMVYEDGGIRITVNTDGDAVSGIVFGYAG